MPFLYEHRRRVPTQDIDRSIDIGVGCVAATLTGKSRANRAWLLPDLLFTAPHSAQVCDV